MEVLVTNVFGRSVEYLIDEGWTVQQLKNIYARDLETSCSSWYLMYNGKFLQNHHLLSDYNIQNDSIIHVTYRHINRMTNPVELRIVYSVDSDERSSQKSRSYESLVVRQTKTVVMYAEADWSIDRVKREFAKIRGVNDWKYYRLFANGICLQEKLLLADYHIHNDAVLTFTLSSRSRNFGILSLKRYIIRKYFLKAF